MENTDRATPTTLRAQPAPPAELRMQVLSLATQVAASGHYDGSVTELAQSMLDFVVPQEGP